MANLNFTGFFYIEGNSNGCFDSSMSFTDRLKGSNYSMMKLLGAFKDPVTLTYQLTSLTPVEADRKDDVARFIVENDLALEGGQRNEIDTSNDDYRWQHFFRIANYIYNYFYTNTGMSITEIRNKIDRILYGEDTSDTSVSRFTAGGVYKGELKMATMVSDPSKLAWFSFRLQGQNLEENAPVNTFTCYVNPDSFMGNYIPSDPYVYAWYKPLTSVDQVNSQEVMANGISTVQGEIAGKIVNNYRRYNTRTVIDGVQTTTPIHIWSNQAIPDADNIMQNNFFKNYIQNLIRVSEPNIAGSEDALIEKYPDIFTSEIRILYMVANKTRNNVKVRTDYLLANPISLETINLKMSTIPILQQYVDENIEIFTVKADEIWVPIIAAGGITDKFPAYRPTDEGLAEIHEGVPEDSRIAETFLDTLVRIINNAFDGKDFNDDFYGTLNHDAPSIVKPAGDVPYYSFNYKAVEWRVYAEDGLLNSFYYGGQVGVRGRQLS